MKWNRKRQVVFVLIAIAVIALLIFIVKAIVKKEPGMRTEEIEVTRGSIQTRIMTIGSVEPQNRLEMMPPIGGRIEEILVEEGDRVKKGQIVAWISSTERAALFDAASARGEKETEYWQDVYKPTPLIAPIDGEVIVRSVEPGQTISGNSVVLVLSDRLIVKARVDETDIGKVKVGQTAGITLDAYPDVKARGVVDHISYESRLINNVTVYEVEVIPEKVPEVFRSGMSAEVAIIQEKRDNILVVPLEAVDRKGGITSVLIKDTVSKQEEKRRVTLGVSDDTNVEIVEGVKDGETIVVRKSEYRPPDVGKTEKKSPFMPFKRRKKRK